MPLIPTAFISLLIQVNEHEMFQNILELLKGFLVQRDAYASNYSLRCIAASTYKYYYTIVLAAITIHVTR